MVEENYIDEIGGKFSINRVFNEKKYNFGIFDTYDDALDYVDYLEEEGWPISLSGDKIDESSGTIDFSNNIEENGGKFIVFKYICGEKVIFGEFESLKTAKKIKNNLIANAWESMETNTRSKYSKYITKSGDKFAVNRTYDGKLHNFGYFKSFEDALERREELIANNWDELDIPLTMKCGKYISFNGIMYTITKSIDGHPHVYGFFNSLENAIKQRDWLIDNNWLKLEVPDDSRRYIHKQYGKFLIYKRSHDDLEYFGTYNSFEEAKLARNKLIENNWQIFENLKDVEKVSEFVYFDGEYYTIEREVNCQRRIYGIYKNKKQAISYEKFLISYDWDGLYAVPTIEYPYGENIVPFDYIFILERIVNGVREELGTFYNFNDVVTARNEKLGNFNDEMLSFSVKIGKSYKNRGWSIIRDSTYDLIPKLDYEDECDIIIDGIPAKAKLNLLPRIFYNKEEKIIDHLETLSKSNPDGRINVQLLLNKGTYFEDTKLKINDLNSHIDKLIGENNELKSNIDETNKIINYMDDEINNYLTKIDTLNRIIKELSEINLDFEEINSISDWNIRIKILDILDKIELLSQLD